MKKDILVVLIHACIVSAIVGYDIWNMIAGFPPTWEQIIIADLYILFWSWSMFIGMKDYI